MDKRKVICNAIFLAVAIFAFVGCLVGIGFEAFDFWQDLGDAFQFNFFVGLAYVALPITLIFIMLSILVGIYSLLRALNVIKENAFDKYFVIIRRVVIAVTVISFMLVSVGFFSMPV